MQITSKWIRYRGVLPYCKGNLVDIGSGDGEFGKLYFKETGIIPYNVEKNDHILLKDECIDTVTFIGCLNYMTEKERYSRISESYRLLRNGGKCVVTNRTWFGGLLKHLFWPNDGWVFYGYSRQETRFFFESEGYKLIKQKILIPFIINLYVFQK